MDSNKVVLNLHDCPNMKWPVDARDMDIITCPDCGKQFMYVSIKIKPRKMIKGTLNGGL